MSWLALQFPWLGLEVFDIEDAARPVVLVEESRVRLGNPAAADAGIEIGVTLATAQSVCADLRHVHRDEQREHERLHALAQALYRLSPEISVEPPDGLVLEVSRSRRLFGGIEPLVETALGICEALGHRARARCARTPLAALVTARSRRMLEAVPLAHAGLPGGEQTVERLANMGVHTLGPLLELPRRALGQRFGPELTSFLDRLSGRAPDPRTAITPAPDFNRVRHLLDPIRDKEALLFPMQRLLDELMHWLVARQLGTQQLVWVLEGAAQRADERARRSPDPSRVTLRVRFARAEQNRRVFLNITRLKLERTPLPEDVLSIGLAARRLEPWQSDSHALFRDCADLRDCADVLEHPGIGEAGRAEASSEIHALLDELGAKLGHHVCRGIAARDRHAPEAAWHPVRPAVRSRRGKRTKQRAVRAPERPLWLFDPPRPVDRSELTLRRGPERIRTAWWQRSIVRDYYVAKHENGAECWVFVEGDDHWYLHGYFA